MNLLLGDYAYNIEDNNGL